MIAFTVTTCSEEVCGQQLNERVIHDVMARVETELLNAFACEELNAGHGISIELFPRVYRERGEAWEHETKVEIRA